MICISKNLPSIVILNVAVIVLLSVHPATETFLIPLGASVLFQPGTYFDGVWSRFVTIDFGILLFSIMETIGHPKIKKSNPGYLKLCLAESILTPQKISEIC